MLCIRPVNFKLGIIRYFDPQTKRHYYIEIHHISLPSFLEIIDIKFSKDDEIVNETSLCYVLNMLFFNSGLFGNLTPVLDLCPLLEI